MKKKEINLWNIMKGSIIWGFLLSAFSILIVNPFIPKIQDIGRVYFGYPISFFAKQPGLIPEKIFYTTNYFLSFLLLFLISALIIIAIEINEIYSKK